MSSFLNLSLDLPDNLEAKDIDDDVMKPQKGVELVELLRAFAKPEILDADNQWLCGGCNTKVQATKYQEFKKLPPRLFVHLKRFRFDPV